MNSRFSGHTQNLAMLIFVFIIHAKKRHDIIVPLPKALNSRAKTEGGLKTR
jgi:hypothetical protein